MIDVRGIGVWCKGLALYFMVKENFFKRWWFMHARVYCFFFLSNFFPTSIPILTVCRRKMIFRGRSWKIFSLLQPLNNVQKNFMSESESEGRGDISRITIFRETRYTLKCNNVYLIQGSKSNFEYGIIKILFKHTEQSFRIWR